MTPPLPVMCHISCPGATVAQAKYQVCMQICRWGCGCSRFRQRSSRIEDSAAQNATLQLLHFPWTSVVACASLYATCSACTAPKSVHQRPRLIVQRWIFFQVTRGTGSITCNTTKSSWQCTPNEETCMDDQWSFRRAKVARLLRRVGFAVRF